MSKLETLEPNNSQYGIHDYREAVISDRSVVIGAGDVADKFLGVNFSGCAIRIQSSGHATGVILSQSQFSDCVIKASKIQKIAKLDTSFDHCSFKGRYEVGFYGSLSACDFSRARLNQCLFFDTEGLQTCTWPSDGHLLISNLAEHRKDFMQTVPKMSILWIMARKGSEAILVYKDSLKNVESETWESVEAKDYVSTT